MSKVDWINWKTKKEEIINPKEIDVKINDIFQDYNTIVNPIVYEQLKHEINSGALDEKTIKLDNNLPLNELSLSIISNIEEIKKVYENLKEEIFYSTDTQKKIEKEQLINSIENKIKKLKLKKLKANDEELEILNKRINKLKQKLENITKL